MEEYPIIEEALDEQLHVRPFYVAQSVPHTVQYHAYHQLDITMPGKLGRVEAARAAIAYAREYMLTLPEGTKLRQACPKRIVTLFDGSTPVDAHWVVRCYMERVSDDMNMGWEDLLDIELPAWAMPQEGK